MVEVAEGDLIVGAFGVRYATLESIGGWQAIRRDRDILSMQDAGAQHIFDFVDAGLPSTVVPEKEYRKVLRRLLSRIAAADADVLVAEVGASPWNPTTGQGRSHQVM